MHMKINCYECKKTLTKDEVALNKKMLGRNIEKFLCLECLSEYLDCLEDDLLAKIQEFKDQGCTLFS